MQILSVTLTNFKSHSDRQFNFQPGTNAICGENGAGKTSILEAIAWTLFDHAGDYTKEDLIRNGATSAQVRVAFVSNRDGRTYEAQRCTTKGYTLYDPQLNERLPYSRIKEEVTPWLRQHLGVAPGTDLGQLFSSTIGVPQGTFTADFLVTKERRKPIFDKVLKVEEYQQTWKKLADLEKYAKSQVETLEQDIARYGEELQELEAEQAKQQQQQQAIAQAEVELQQAQTRFAQLQQQVDQLTALAGRSQQLDLQLDQLDAQIASQTTTLQQFQTDLDQAEAAVAICTHHREAYGAFGAAEEQLRQLEQHRRTEQGLQQQKRQQERALSDRQTQLAKVSLQLNRVAEARQEIDRLQLDAEQQRELERSQQALGQQLQTYGAVRQTVKEHEKRLGQLQTRRTQLGQEIATIQTLAELVQEIPTLEQQQQRLQQQLSRVAAASQFEADLRQILAQSDAANRSFLAQVEQATKTLKDLQQAVPLWSTALESVRSTLADGVVTQQQLAVALQEILRDLAEQTSIAKLEQQLQQVEERLRAARKHQTRFANLERLLSDYAQLDAEAGDLQTGLATLHAQLVEEPALQEKSLRLASQLADLENPVTRIQLYQAELQQEETLLTNMETVKAAGKTVEDTIAQLDQQLAAFGHLLDDITTQQALRDQHRDAYEIYTANREMANSRKGRLQLVQTTAAQLQDLKQTEQSLLDERDRLRQTFDPNQFGQVQTEHQHVNNQQIALAARLPEMRKALEETNLRLTRLESLQTKQKQAQAELEQKKRIDRFIKFARKSYKEAGPRITECYIQSISREADRLFRELLNRPNVSLSWTRDYEIFVQEGAHSRRFVNLSGGEQMCAALAVRLALLKVLADIDIAFFDEPTTNMDRLRREQLAEAIVNIKTFRQLFVISHDDTFEKVTENIIVVEREA